MTITRLKQNINLKDNIFFCKLSQSCVWLHSLGSSWSWISAGPCQIHKVHWSRILWEHLFQVTLCQRCQLTTSWLPQQSCGETEVGAHRLCTHPHATQQKRRENLLLLSPTLLEIWDQPYLQILMMFAEWGERPQEMALLDHILSFLFRLWGYTLFSPNFQLSPLKNCSFLIFYTFVKRVKQPFHQSPWPVHFLWTAKHDCLRKHTCFYF